MSKESWEFPPAARSVVLARREITGALSRWGLDGLVDAAQLLTSELVTNSVLHARTPVTVTINQREGEIRVAVSDGSAIEPAIRRHSMTSTTGRGLQMLLSLADDWGSEVTKTGKTVWFTLSTGRDHWAGAERVSEAGK
jgi:anti-sigma regulatory factor (Ser/Thr protein kinase)